MEGDAPSPGTYAAANASINDDLFTFGGFDGRNYLNTLHRLDTKTWRWCQLSPTNADGAPMPKASGGMMHFRDNLVVFGGYGIPRGPTEPRSFMKSTSGRGWTNEFHIYHLKEGMLIQSNCVRASAQTWVCVFGWGETEDNSILLIETRVLILSVYTS